MYSIEKSSIFQTDLNQWNRILNECDNEKVKLELQSLINAILKEVKRIDKLHSEILDNNRLTNNVGEYRQNLSLLRKSIGAKITEWESIKENHER